jgi:hypothetical protein
MSPEIARQHQSKKAKQIIGTSTQKSVILTSIPAAASLTGRRARESTNTILYAASSVTEPFSLFSITGSVRSF